MEQVKSILSRLQPHTPKDPSDDIQQLWDYMEMLVQECPVKAIIQIGKSPQGENPFDCGDEKVTLAEIDIIASDKEITVLDVTSKPIPECDLVVVRNLHFHFSSIDIISFFYHLVRSRFHYLIIRSKEIASNTDHFDQWHYRPVNLFEDPYDISEPLHQIGDYFVYTKLQLLDDFPLVCPKVIHQIWVGPHPIPPLHQKCMKTWIEKHPEWTYKLWTDRDVDGFKLYNQDLYDTCSKYAQKSDILRYEILYRYGGLYVDCDFECLKSLDNIVESYEFIAGQETVEGNICNALIGSVPGHPIHRDIVTNIRSHRDKEKDSMITSQTGPHFLTHCINKYKAEGNDQEGLYLPPRTVFYPYGWWESRPSEYPPESLAVHHWSLSWQH